MVLHPHPRFALFSVLLGILFGALSPELAKAQDPTDSTPATAGLLWRATAHAERFWDSKNLPSQCGQVGVFMTSELASTHDAAARHFDCRVWVSRAWWGRTAKSLSDNRGSKFFKARRIRTEEVCALAIHEVGHTRGLDHEAGTVMDGASYIRVMPGACVTFAAKEHPRPNKIRR